jgi:phospholipase DDHD1
VLAIGTLSFEDCVVSWYSKEDVYVEDRKPTLIYKSMSLFKIKSKMPGKRICRGFREKHKDNNMDEKPSEITHLVFVVHGIAQKLYENSIVKNCEE